MKSPGPMEQITTLLLGFDLGMHSMWRSAHGNGKMTYEHSRLAKKVNTGKRPETPMKSAKVHFSDGFL